MPAQVHTRVDLAVEQLEVALGLFLEDRSVVSALTLAGAAEEVLGTAVVFRGGENAMKEKYEAMNASYQAFGGAPLKWKAFSEGENEARNAAKHMRTPDESTIEVDMKDAALWMLVRACANYDRLDLPRTNRMVEFDNWFYEHVVGV